MNFASKPFSFRFDGQTDEIVYVRGLSPPPKRLGARTLPPFSNNRRRSFLLTITPILFS